MSNQPSSIISRRQFLRTAAAGVAIFHILPGRMLAGVKRPSANERINLAGIGMGGQGSGDLGEFMGDSRIKVVAVCDVKNEHLERIKGTVNGRYNNSDCKGYVDYREIIARDDIDVVLCATPDHWHAQVSIDAMKSGKDVYCEKPLTLTIAEGRKMVQTARRHGRVFSCGSQRVIGDYGGLACAARSGVYGKILEAHTDPGGPPRLCCLAGEPIPPNTIDWDMWLGPAPWVPYHSYRCSAAYGLGGEGFRSWYDYSGGMMTDWGGHKFGAALHGMGLDHTGPTEIIPPDGKDYKYLTYVFANGMKLVVDGDEPKYICEKGEAKRLHEFRVPPGLRWYEDGANSPIQDLINCVTSRKRPFQDVEYAHRTATVCHLGNICYKLNRKLRWDAEKEAFIGDTEANRLVDRPRRGPWQI